MDNIKQVVKDIRFLIATDCCDKTIQARIENFINDAQITDLLIHDVSDQRELLKVFFHYVDMEWANGSLTNKVDEVIDGFEKSL